MSLYSAFKRDAKSALKNNWGKAIGVTLIPVGTFLLLHLLFMGAMAAWGAGAQGMVAPAYYGQSFSDFLRQMGTYMATMGPIFVVSVGYTLGVFFLGAPLGMGTTRWFYQLIHGKVESVTSVFYYFEKAPRFFRTIWLNIQLSVRSMLWSVAFFLIPGVVLGGAVVGYTYIQSRVGDRVNGLFALALILWCLLLLAVAVGYSAYMNKYLLAPYFIFEDEELTVGPAIKRSIEETKGYRFQLLWFSLTFIGWFLLTAFPPVALYTMPYYTTALSLYAKYIMEKNKREQPVVADGPEPEQEESSPLIAPPSGAPVADEEDI